MRLTRTQLRRLIESALYENKKKVTPETIRRVLKNNFDSYDIVSAPVRDNAGSLGTLFFIDISSGYGSEEDYDKKELKKQFTRVINVLSEFKSKNSGFDVIGISEQLKFLGINYDSVSDKIYARVGAEQVLFQGGSAQIKVISGTDSDNVNDIASLAEEGFSGTNLGSVIEDENVLNSAVVFLINFN